MTSECTVNRICSELHFSQGRKIFSRTMFVRPWQIPCLKVKSSNMNDIFGLPGTFVTWDSKLTLTQKRVYMKVLNIYKLWQGFQMFPILVIFAIYTVYSMSWPINSLQSSVYCAVFLILYLYCDKRRDILWNIAWARLYFTVYPNLSHNTDIFI